MSDCTHDCSSCKDTCEKKDFLAKPREDTRIKKIIAVVSGKGGVGKSMVTDLLASATLKKGYKTAVLDADITGPSVPKAFGLTDKALALEDGSGILPVTTTQGIKVMSMNLLLPSDGDPVVWRGPVISGAVQQFYTDVVWGDVDYMYVDMPPGTGDVPDGVPVSADRRNNSRNHPAGSRFDDSRKGGKNGRDDEYKNLRHSRKHELYRLPALRRKTLSVRQKRDKRSRRKIFPARPCGVADRRKTFGGCR